MACWRKHACLNVIHGCERLAFSTATGLWRPDADHLCHFEAIRRISIGFIVGKFFLGGLQKLVAILLGRALFKFSYWSIIKEVTFVSKLVCIQYSPELLDRFQFLHKKLTLSMSAVPCFCLHTNTELPNETTQQNFCGFLKGMSYFPSKHNVGIKNTKFPIYR